MGEPVRVTPGSYTTGTKTTARVTGKGNLTYQWWTPFGCPHAGHLVVCRGIVDLGQGQSNFDELLVELLHTVTPRRRSHACPLSALGQLDPNSFENMEATVAPPCATRARIL